MDERDWLAERFEEHRTRLRAVAYRMLGSLSEADDAVQEAWLRLSRSDADEIENLGGWLTTVVGRVSLNMLRSRKSRREEPFAVHLPEPIVDRADGTDPEHEALVADSVGLALLVVLETLSPAERLAFVLHDIFGVPFDEIAPIVDRSPEAARQLASRARRRVRAENTVPDADLDAQREVVEPSSRPRARGLRPLGRGSRPRCRPASRLRRRPARAKSAGRRRSSAGQVLLGVRARHEAGASQRRGREWSPPGDGKPSRSGAFTVRTENRRDGLARRPRPPPRARPHPPRLRRHRAGGRGDQSFLSAWCVSPMP